MVSVNITAAWQLPLRVTAMDNLHDLALNITHVRTAATGGGELHAITTPLSSSVRLLCC